MTDPDPKTCFIAMPVSTSAEHAELFGDPDHWKHVLESLFVPAARSAGFEPVRPTAKGSHMIHAEIVKHLSTADMVMVDMSQDNPNVFFELGVRTSVNKPIALVRCDAGVRIPFDVSGINTHAYDPRLKAFHIEKEIESLAEHLREAESSCSGTNPMWTQFGLELTASEPSTGGVSKQEAMLEVLTKQVDEISRRVIQSRNGSAGRPNNSGDAITPPLEERDADGSRSGTEWLLGAGVAALARRYDVDYDIDETPEGDPVVILFDPDEVTYDKSNRALMRDAERIGTKVYVGRTSSRLGSKRN